MMSITSPPGFSGDFISPDHPDYERLRHTFIELEDRLPVAIAVCQSREDIAAALALARENDLEVAIRSGRHSVPGFSSTDGGIIIDISALKGMEIDPESGTARVEAGVLAGELLAETVKHGLAPVSGSESFPSFVGLAIHGGRGLFRRHGWASDRIIGATVITADGKTVRVSPDENSDLLYGIRGAGSNFGVVTELEVELVPIPAKVRGGKLLYNEEGWEQVLPAILAGLEEGAYSDGLGVILTLFPVASGTLLELTVVHIDEPDRAAPDIDQILSIAEPIDGEIGLLPYDEFIALTELIDILRVHWAEQGSDASAGELAKALLEEIRRMPATDSEIPSRMLTIEPLGPGFLAEASLPTPVPRRSDTSFAFFSAWTDSSEDDEMIWWARDAWSRMQERGVGSGVPILNYNSWTGPEGVERAYGSEAFRKLQALKTAWDPDNVFHRNHNIPPG